MRTNAHRPPRVPPLKQSIGQNGVMRYRDLILYLWFLYDRLFSGRHSRGTKLKTIGIISALWHKLLANLNRQVMKYNKTWNRNSLCSDLQRQHETARSLNCVKSKGLSCLLPRSHRTDVVKLKQFDFKLLNSTIISHPLYMSMSAWRHKSSCRICDETRWNALICQVVIHSPAPGMMSSFTKWHLNDALIDKIVVWFRKCQKKLGKKKVEDEIIKCP